MLTNQLDASKLLEALRPGVDAVVKGHPQLPSFELGADIDFVSIDPDGLAKALVEVAGDGWAEIRLNSIGPGRSQVQLFGDRGLHLLLDIFPPISPWRRISLKESFFHRLIATYQLRDLPAGSNFPEADKLHNAIFRYCEYCEYFWSGPNKVHHLDWISDQLNSREKSLFFELLHYYVEFESHTLDSARPSTTPAKLMFFKLFARFRPRLVAAAKFLMRKSYR